MCNHVPSTCCTPLHAAAIEPSGLKTFDENRRPPCWNKACCCLTRPMPDRSTVHLMHESKVCSCVVPHMRCRLCVGDSAHHLPACSAGLR